MGKMPFTFQDGGRAPHLQEAPNKAATTGWAPNKREWSDRHRIHCSLGFLSFPCNAPTRHPPPWLQCHPLMGPSLHTWQLEQQSHPCPRLSSPPSPFVPCLGTACPPQNNTTHKAGIASVLFSAVSAAFRTVATMWQVLNKCVMNDAWTQKSCAGPTRFQTVI